MPLIKVHTQPAVADDKKEPLMGEIAQCVADISGKSLEYMMVVLEDADIQLGGTSSDSAYIDFRGIGGISPESNAAITSGLCELFQTELGISPDRVYITFTDVPAQNWGWNNKLFG